eukprot:TRINITY_DN2169_c0_g2_i1.p1 TRINITY_DN2169_c0_g2~~TRINITY_DN2169_c0_g2_i1.p1  ORF type:complete len:245 (+),score=35.92 TRINITY_DN2169_c0_g2_i1:435-1169(+)
MNIATSIRGSFAIFRQKAAIAMEINAGAEIDVLLKKILNDRIHMITTGHKMLEKNLKLGNSMVFRGSSCEKGTPIAVITSVGELAEVGIAQLNGLQFIQYAGCPLHAKFSEGRVIAHVGQKLRIEGRNGDIDVVVIKPAVRKSQTRFVNERMIASRIPDFGKLASPLTASLKNQIIATTSDGKELPEGLSGAMVCTLEGKVVGFTLGRDIYDGVHAVVISPWEQVTNTTGWKEEAYKAEDMLQY